MTFLRVCTSQQRSRYANPREGAHFANVGSGLEGKRVTARKPFGPYVYNFVFVPHAEAALAAQCLVERLANLRGQ